MLTGDESDVTAFVRWTGQHAPQNWLWDCRDLWIDVTNKVGKLTGWSNAVGYKTILRISEQIWNVKRERVVEVATGVVLLAL